MIIDREKLKSQSKAKLGLADSTPKSRFLKNYRPSALQKRSKIFSSIIGIFMFLALILGILFLTYTLIVTGKSIIEKKMANASKPPVYAPTEADVEIQFNGKNEAN